MLPKGGSDPYCCQFIVGKIMLEPNQYVNIKWNPNNVNHYRGLGYKFTKFGDVITIPISHLTLGSHQKVLVKCDYCGDVMHKTYKDYVRDHNDKFGDACVKCKCKKFEKVCMDKYGYKTNLMCEDTKRKIRKTNIQRYGGTTPASNESVRAKMRETTLQRYGVDNYSKTQECKEKVAKTNLEQYGHTCYLQSEDGRQKSLNTLYKNGTTKTSKPQMALYNLLLDMYGNCELNYPIIGYSADCFLRINGFEIDVEYDGKYYHQFTQNHDNLRDKRLIGKGIKVFRIKGNYNIPTYGEIKGAIDALLKGENYIEIEID